MKMKMLRPVLGVSLVLWVLLALAYPFVMMGMSRLLFPYQSQGSLVQLNGRLIGVAHVGQNFEPHLQYFWGRPSATTSVSTGKPEPYNAYASSPSNLGPTNQQLLTDVQQRIRFLQKTTPGLQTRKIPADLVESSGSGLDPDITVQAALIQIPRVAKATGLSTAFLTQMVDSQVKGLQLGVFGKRRVNVLQLNLTLYQFLHAQK